MGSYQKIWIFSKNNVDVAEDSTFIKRNITGNETWEYDVETVQESSEWRSKN